VFRLLELESPGEIKNRVFDLSDEDVPLALPCALHARHIIRILLYGIQKGDMQPVLSIE